MRYTKKQLSAFEAGDSSSWIVQFLTPNSLNLIAGKYFPAISVKFNLFEPTNVDVDVAPGYKFKIPSLVTTPSEVEIEFYDNDSNTIHKSIQQLLLNSLPAAKGRSILNVTNPSASLNSAISMMIEKQSKTHKVLERHYIVGWPSSPMSFSGDQEFKALQNSLSLDILAYETK